MCKHNELQPGAVMVDTTTKRLYEVSVFTGRTTRLIDVASPIDDPFGVEFLTSSAVKRLELVRQAPCVDDVASVLEFGGMGTAPT